MNPNIKRYAPIAGVVAVLVVGVYFIAGDRLTGQAEATDPNIAHLGKVQPMLLEKLDDLVKAPMLPHVLEGQRPAATAKIPGLDKLGPEALLPEALASVALHFRDNGCTQPGSTSEVQLLTRLVEGETVTPIQRRVVAFILIDAAAHAAKDFDFGTDKPFTKYPAVGKVASQIGDGNATEIPALDLSPEDPVIAFECSMQALATTARLLHTGIIDGATLHDKALVSARALPAAHPVGPAFVKVAALAANASKQPVAAYAEIASDTNLGDESRAEACRGAIAAGVPVAELNKALNKPRPPAVEHCLVVGGEPATITSALSSDDIDLQVSAIGQDLRTADPSKIGSALAAADNADAPARVRRAWLAGVARAVIASDDPEKLVKPIVELAEAKPASLVPTQLAGLFQKMNPKKVTFARVAEGEEQPSVATALLALATGEGAVAVPDTLVRGIGEQDAEMEVDATETAKLRPQEVEDVPFPFCDATVGPGPAQAVIEAALKDDSVQSICMLEGTYAGPLVLRKAGIQLYAEGAAVLANGVVLEAPVTLVNLDVRGPVVVSAGARGAILVGNKLQVGGVSETTQIAASYNELPEGKRFAVPGGHIEASGASRPPAAWFSVSPNIGGGKLEKATIYKLTPKWPPIL